MIVCVNIHPQIPTSSRVLRFFHLEASCGDVYIRCFFIFWIKQLAPILTYINYDHYLSMISASFLVWYWDICDQWPICLVPDRGWARRLQGLWLSSEKCPQMPVGTNLPVLREKHVDISWSISNKFSKFPFWKLGWVTPLLHPILWTRNSVGWIHSSNWIISQVLSKLKERIFVDFFFKRVTHVENWNGSQIRKFYQQKYVVCSYFRLGYRHADVWRVIKRYGSYAMMVR